MLHWHCINVATLHWHWYNIVYICQAVALMLMRYCIIVMRLLGIAYSCILDKDFRELHTYPSRRKDKNQEFSLVWYTLYMYRTSLYAIDKVDVTELNDITKHYGIVITIWRTVCNWSDCIIKNPLSEMKGMQDILTYSPPSPLKVYQFSL